MYTVTILELKDGGYHMVRGKKGRFHPIGYCTDHGGHDSKEEAANCYEEYIMEELYDDSNWNLDNKKVECDVCGEWGQYVYFGGLYEPFPIINACEEHATKETVSEEVNITEGYTTYES